MVAVREYHHSNTNIFELESWLHSLSIEADIADHLRTDYLLLAALAPLELDLLHRGCEIVDILRSLNMDKHVLRVGLFFLILQPRRWPDEQIAERFGQNELNLFNGVLQMSSIEQLLSSNSDTVAESQDDDIRRMLLSMIDDYRCVVIKLIERLTRLREVSHAPDELRQVIASNCARIYAPLANRLGLGKLKWEFEDHIFHYQHADIYKEIASKLAERRLDREYYIKQFITDLHLMMKQNNLAVLDIYGRPKHIFSIWRKMQRKKLSFEQLFDIRAVRIIAKTEADCYAVLSVIHKRFEFKKEWFDNYIVNPKQNGYQSLHTIVVGPQNKTVEIQIRTQEMHDTAENGIAAHWIYKEGRRAGSRNTSVLDDKILWLRSLLSWQEEITNPNISSNSEMVKQVSRKICDDRIFVFTPKGQVVDLPLDATPLDFAYHIHSNVGHCCIGAKVNNKIVTFTHALQMGDQVEIITQKEPNPSRDWLNPSLGYVRSGRARSKINNWFRKQSREKNLSAGKEILDKELVLLKIPSKSAIVAIEKFNTPTLDDLYIGIGSGDLRINQVVNYIDSQINKPDVETETEKELQKMQQRVVKINRPQENMVVIDSINNLMSKIANCCNPIPGDSITGYVTQGKGISIHRSDCEQLAELRIHAPDRIINNTIWSSDYQGSYSQRVLIRAEDRNGLVKEINSLFSNEKIKVGEITTKMNDTYQERTLIINIVLDDLDTLNRVLQRISQIEGVFEAKRYG